MTTPNWRVHPSKMKFEDYLASRHITDDTPDAELVRLLNIRMFGVTFLRYLRNPTTTQGDFQDAYDFIRRVEYLDKYILPGRTYQQAFSSIAVTRRFNLDTYSPPATESDHSDGPDVGGPPGARSAGPSTRGSTSTPGRGSRGRGTGRGGTEVPETPRSPDPGSSRRVDPGSSRGRGRGSRRGRPTPEREGRTTLSGSDSESETERLSRTRRGRRKIAYQTWRNDNGQYLYWKLMNKRFPEIIDLGQYPGTAPPPLSDDWIDSDVESLHNEILSRSDALNPTLRDGFKHAFQDLNLGQLNRRLSDRVSLLFQRLTKDQPRDGSGLRGDNKFVAELLISMEELSRLITELNEPVVYGHRSTIH